MSVFFIAIDFSVVQSMCIKFDVGITNRQRLGTKETIGIAE